jgi:hypothetical protein
MAEYSDILRAVKSSMSDAADLIDAAWKGSLKTVPTTGGSANAYTATISGISSYTSGQVIAVFISASCTGATTINVNALGTKNVYYKGYALVGGELVTNQLAIMVYDGTQFQLVNHGGGWATWSPTIGATGSMTVGSTSTSYAKYQRHGSRVVFEKKINYTPGGTRNNAITSTLPIAPAQAGTIGFPCEVFDTGLSGDVALGHAFSVSTTTLYVFRYDQATWTASACNAYITGTYDV